MDLISTPVNGPLLTVATRLKESTIRGNICSLIPAKATSSSSHSPFKLHMYVRLAFDASVTYYPVRLKITQVSMVPNLIISSSTAFFISGTFYRSHCILKEVKYVDTGRPVLFLN